MYGTLSPAQGREDEQETNALESTNVPRRRGALFQPVTVPDGTFTGIGGHLKVLRKLEAIGGAGIFTKAAKHAARSVVGERRQHFTASEVIALPAHHDQIFRASQRTQIAGNTQGFARLRIDIQARGAAIALGNHGPLERVL